ncbi:extracellular matrix-binding ebh [Babesia caballi]|uniref:Extracellular matrix-binding ebh n=1 Tax=Babesia caballi TaxID=5871 RepID=A0AAV4M282_BABCB|nr:extracellular matrix-binding ebh [Babesia caballi]
MGFNSHLQSDNKTGENIYDTLAYFCGDSKDCLCQLSEKLSCLVKRAPRSLGDLFGFIWHLNGQLFNTSDLESKLQAALQQSDAPPQPISKFLDNTISLSGSTLLNKSLGNLSDHVTFWDTPDSYGIASLLATNLFSLNQHYHKEEIDETWGTIKITHYTKPSAAGHSNTAADLWSLFRIVNNSTSATCASSKCGGYLNPLVFSSGATFTPNHASAYLSWLLYLTDDFNISLQEFLDAINGHKCAGCPKSCSPSGNSSNHASQCSCPNIVECGDILSLLYTHGFYFNSASSLKGGRNGTDSTKRQCQHFSQQLSSVIQHSENTPLFKLLTTIDSFLYAIRWEFFSKLCGFWTIYICLILYTLFFHLDAIKLLSFPLKSSSHSIAPAALLTTGKPIPVTKLAYLVS